jgi:hypothetical protein
MIGTFERKNVPAIFARVEPEADIFGATSTEVDPTVGEEHVFKRGRRDRDETARAVRLVEQVRLRPDRLHDRRIAVAMRHDPPRRDGVEGPAPAGCFEPLAFGSMTSGRGVAGNCSRSGTIATPSMTAAR